MHWMPATWPPGSYRSAQLTAKPRPDFHRLADNSFAGHTNDLLAPPVHLRRPSFSKSLTGLRLGMRGLWLGATAFDKNRRSNAGKYPKPLPEHLAFQPEPNRQMPSH